MSTRVTLIGNEGFLIEAGPARILIDAFYGAIPGLASASALSAHSIEKADLILVTHAHWDHFQATEVADVANRTGATVVGPAAVVNELRRKAWPERSRGLPAEKLVKLEPVSARQGFALSEKAHLSLGERSSAVRRTGEGASGASGTLTPALSPRERGGTATVTAFRTFHAMGHNSYLVETPGFRFFHDGDNEDTRRIDASALGRLDALLIGPWQGSGWVEFIEKLSPARWFLMHLSEEELDQHEAGAFLPDLCGHVPLPDRLVVLRPGQSFAFD